MDNHTEKNYDFRKRLADIHIPRRINDANPRQNNECEIDDKWVIVPMTDDIVVNHAVEDLQDYFLKSMCLNLVIQKNIEPNQYGIIIGLSKEKSDRTSRIIVDDTGIQITGSNGREAAQGCYRLEDELNLRGAPFAKKGTRTFTRMFSPRMTHSGWELEMFPDEYLPHIAHAGMDAIIVFIREAPDITRNGKIDMPALVQKAAVYGLDVYAYPHVHTQASKCHPDDPDAEKFFDDLYGSIIRNAPGIRGIIFVGESCAFPSHDPDVGGYWWNRKDSKKYINGFWPSSDWPRWLCMVRDVMRKYNCDLDILFWTYNWFWAPEKDRIRLLEQIPTDITLHVTYEMGDTPVYKCGIPTWVEDYSITSAGPCKVFISEAKVAARRGIRLSSMTNSGGMTWDCGVVPFMPVPYKWKDRYHAIRESYYEWGLRSLMECHHYGFTPSFISELAKICFTEEYDTESSFNHAIYAIASRDFGVKNADIVISAWKDWSDAFYWHSARAFDQYGALRNGPVYPFTLPHEPMPEPLHPQYEYNNGIKHGTGWKYLMPSFSMPEDLIAGHLEMAENELHLLESGNKKLKKVIPDVPQIYRDNAKRVLGIGEFLYHTVRTMRNVKRYYQLGLELNKKALKKQNYSFIIAQMLGILQDERSNVQETIPLVEYDSRLGWEPSMLYTTDKENLEWKLKQLLDAEKELNDKY